MTPSYKALQEPRYVEFTYLSAEVLTTAQQRMVFKTYPWCCYIGMPGAVVITREQFFAPEAKKILELKRARKHILTSAALIKLCS